MKNLSDENMLINSTNTSNQTPNNNTTFKLSAKELENLIKSKSNFIFEKDLNGKLTYLSPRVTEQIGLKITEIFENIENLMADQLVNKNNYDKWVKGKQNFLPYEIEIKKLNGSKCKVEIQETIILDEQNNHKILGIGSLKKYQESCRDNLIKSEDNYRLLVENLTELVIKFDITGRITFVTPNYFETFNVTPDQVIGKKFMPQVHPEDYPQIKEKLISALQPPYDCNHEERMLTVKGWRWFSWRNKAIPSKDGSVNEIVSVGRDINERLENHKEIQKLALIAKETDNAVVITDKNRHIEWVNEGFTKLTGYSFHEIKGKIPGNFLQGEETDKKTVQEINEAIRNRIKIKAELINYTKDGRKYWVELNIQPIFDQAGKLEKYISIESDITQRKNAEAEIKKLALIAKETDNAIVITDKNQNIEWVNEGFTKICGYTFEEVLGKKPGKFLQGEETDQKTVAKIRNTLRAGEKIKAELINYRKSGEKYWIEVNIQPIRDEEGKITQFISIESDITERKKSEEKLRLTQSRLEEAQKIAKIGNWEWNIQTNKIWWSDQTYKLFGLEPNAIELDFDKFIEFVKEPDREKLKAAVNESINNLIDYNIECTIIRKDGKEIFINAQGKVFTDEKNTPMRMAGSFQDISERKEAEKAIRFSEEKFSKAFFTAPDALMISTYKEGEIIEVNEGFEKIFEYKKNEVIGKTFKEIGVWKNPKRRIEAMKILHKENKLRNEIGQFITKNGNVGFGDLSIDVIYINEQKHLLSILKDITERKKAEKEIEDYQNNLKLLSSQITIAEQEERRRIAIDLHDNLSQSLAIAKIKVSEVQRDCENLNTLEKFTSAKKQLDKAIRSSRLITYELSPPILYELGFSAAVRWRLEQVEKEFNIQTELIDEAEHIELEIDVRVLLFRAALEIITNAIKHSRANRFKVLCKCVDEQLEIEFSDNGVGFNLDEAEKQAIKKKSLGLFSLRERISFINGTININSRIGEGTVITIKIPNISVIN